MHSERDFGDIRAIALVSNNISAAMARRALEIDGYDLANVFLIKQRQVDIEWADECGKSLDFGRKPSLTLLGQTSTIPFYLQSVRSIRKLLSSGSIKDIYIPNIDNLITNHILQRKKKQPLKNSFRLSVVAEGFMNFQSIGLDDRAGWRWAVKPTLAMLLGLDFKTPEGHLSGSYESIVERIFSYSADGIKAPAEKVITVPFPSVEPEVEAAPKSAMVILTGIGQWMAPDEFAKFRDAFATFVNSQGFEKVFIKRHPYYPSGNIEDLIEGAEIINDSRRLEQYAAFIPAATVIGYCTTGLVTLKLMRADLRFIDWGSNFYCEHAYHGDRSIIDVLNSAKIEIVDM